MEIRETLTGSFAKGPGIRRGLRKYTCAPISRILYPPCGGPPSSIWDAPHGAPLSTYPPDHAGRAYPALRREFRLIWSFSPWGLPSCPAHTRHWWALTPPFHPCLAEALAKAGLHFGSNDGRFPFLWHFPWRRRHQRRPFPLGSTVPYAARTFLPFRLAAEEATEQCAGCQTTIRPAYREAVFFNSAGSRWPWPRIRSGAGPHHRSGRLRRTARPCALPRAGCPRPRRVSQ